MRRAMRVAVIGCGFAGAAAALLIARAGHEVAVYEAVPEPVAVGAGILLQPTGMAVLARLGVLGDVLARAARVAGLRMRTIAGRELMWLPYASVDERWFGAGLHRGAVHEVLLDAVRRELPDALRCGVAIADVQGREVVDEHGGRRGSYDLIVVADGARSRLRDRLTEARATPYRWATAWAILPDPERTCAGELYQVVDGTRRLMGLLPTGLGPRGGETPLVSLYWGIDHRKADDFKRAGLDALRRDLREFDARAAKLAESLDSIDEVLVARYQRVVMRPWHRGRVVFIGDAAHAMSPQLGQGTNLALWDAAVLADCLAECRDEADVPRALAAYTRQRRGPIAYYELAAHALMPFFQTDLPGMSWLRDLAFAVMSRLPIARDQMLRTMAGIKRGILRPSLALDLPALPAVRR
jgi:2-polyprenyl-6-methoxyphenol hydroxylase-like FAD-dependent oxidoreductase